MGHILDDVVGQKRRQLATALGRARGVQLPLFAGESDKHLVLARIAFQMPQSR